MSIKKHLRFLFPVFPRRRLTVLLLLVVIGISLLHTHLRKSSPSSSSSNYRRRPGCKCLRPNLTSKISLNRQRHSCSEYATQRGPHQRIIAISLFGPKEKAIFQVGRSLIFLKQLIRDVNVIYPDRFILRVYHDETIGLNNIICPIECAHPNVDFCSMKGNNFIPPKIWRFLPAGDPLVDLMMSRDLDSPLTKRERTAVNVWLASNHSFHVMRDHPKHRIRMLGGMWGFRPALNRKLSHEILQKIYDRQVVVRYQGRADQSFLKDHVWPIARFDTLAHDSFHCKVDFGHQPVPFPTERTLEKDRNCYVGVVRNGCPKGKMPFEPCPEECRPEKHPEWIYC